VDSTTVTETARPLLAAVLMALALTGCRSADPGGSSVAMESDSVALVYDQLVLEVLTPAAAEREIDNASKGSAAREGLGMTLASPVSCMYAGPAYPLCIVAAPLFPFWYAARHQDAEISSAQLETLAAAIESVGFVDRLRDSLERRARAEGLPVSDGAIGSDGAARLVVQPAALRLVHEGYDDRWITITQPYVIALYGPGGSVSRQLKAELSRRIQLESWDAQLAELPVTLADWVERISERAVMDTALEWSPRVVLEPVHPMPVVKRSALGFRREYWPDVESTHPRLAWQSLDTVLHASTLAQVTDITYELEILPAVRDTWRIDPEAFRYTVAGLTEPAHQLPVALEPCSRYVWRPRARFRYRGVWHATALRVRPMDASDHRPNSYLLRAAPDGCDGVLVAFPPVASAGRSGTTESGEPAP